MAILKNTNDLLTQAGATLQNNSTQQISPADVREAVENTAFSSYNKVSDSALVGLKAYSASAPYESGQGCTYLGNIYISNQVTGPGAFNPAHWVLFSGSGENQDYLKTGLSGGINYGGVLSIGSPTSKFSISAGQGYVIDNYTTPNTPTLHKVDFSAINNITVTNIATQLITFVSLDKTGAVIQRGTRWSASQIRDEIVLGVVVHVNNTVVDAVNNEQHGSVNLGAQIGDIFEALGFLNISGNIFSAASTNLTIAKTAGVLWAHGVNYQNDTKNPNYISLGALSPATFQYRFKNGTNGATGTNINPNIYDVAGVSTAVPNNKFTIQRIYSFTSNNVKIQPGQNLYNSLAEARGAIQTEVFTVESSLNANGLFRGVLIVQEGTTNLATTTKAEFLSANKFGGSTGIGGTSVSTLQNVYDNSSDPEILTSTARGPVTIKRGSAADSDNILEGQNGAGSQTFSVTGLGLVQGRNMATDGSKLDGIEALADVTDAANVNAAGATMNTDTSLTGNSYFLNDGTFAGNDATKVPSQASVKTYVDTALSGASSMYTANGTFSGPRTAKLSGNTSSEFLQFQNLGAYDIMRVTGDRLVEFGTGSNCYFDTSHTVPILQFYNVGSDVIRMYDYYTGLLNAKMGIGGGQGFLRLMYDTTNGLELNALTQSFIGMGGAGFGLTVGGTRIATEVFGVVGSSIFNGTVDFRKVTTYTAASVTADNDYTILCDATSNAITVNLPTAVGIKGRIYVVKKTDVSANLVTLDASGSQTIDGTTTSVLNSQNDSVTVQSDNANWFVIASNYV